MAIKFQAYFEIIIVKILQISFLIIKKLKLLMINNNILNLKLNN
jgi:hypothetical protein